MLSSLLRIVAAAATMANAVAQEPATPRSLEDCKPLMTAEKQLDCARAVIDYQRKNPPTQDPRPTPKAMIGKPNAAHVKAVRAAMGDRLRDPYSAQLSDMFTVTYRGERAVTVCGTVNAKNAFGAYVGKAPFAFHDDGKGGRDFWTADSPGGDVMITAFCGIPRGN